ncbi:MAG TPA: choice-of-anchor L domain-containing protein, partial [Bacteroidales bacterium]|nr:choice-of-anchor L domain-containing protein [Bacteroidales bacterium]
MVQEILIGGGVETFNIVYTGNNISRGKFWGGPGNIGIEEGIILTSGAVTVAPGPNNSGSAGSNSGQGSDPDLVLLSGTSINDRCLLEFDFIPQSTVVTFKYCFGSEEYHEYVDQFNDAFGFFISGPGISGPYSN